MARLSLSLVAIVALCLGAPGHAWSQQRFVLPDYGIGVTIPAAWTAVPAAPNVFKATADPKKPSLTFTISAAVSPQAGLMRNQDEVNAWWGGAGAAFQLHTMVQQAQGAGGRGAGGFDSSLVAFGGSGDLHPARVVAQGRDSIGGAVTLAVLIEKAYVSNYALMHTCTWSSQLMTVALSVTIVATEIRTSEFCTASHIMHPELASIVRSIALEPPSAQLTGSLVAAD